MNSSQSRSLKDFVALIICVFVVMTLFFSLMPWLVLLVRWYERYFEWVLS